MKGEVKPTLPFDPFAIAQATSEFALGLAMKPTELMEVQLAAAQQWGDFWTGALSGRKARSRATAALPRRNGRTMPIIARSATPICWPPSSCATWFRSAKAGKQHRDGQLPARPISERHLAPNFAATNPEVVKRTKETNGANLVQGFAHLIEDIASGKGIVQRRTDPTAFEKGKTIAATPGEVVFENDLFQLIQYTPTTDKVAAEPLLYVPPLVNRYYMIDLVPRQSLVKWLVDEGRTVFVISWVNPTEAHKDKGVGDYVLGRHRRGDRPGAGAHRASPDLFAFCLGGTLVAIALAWLAAKSGRTRSIRRR